VRSVFSKHELSDTRRVADAQRRLGRRGLGVRSERPAQIGDVSESAGGLLTNGHAPEVVVVGVPGACRLWGSVLVIFLLTVLKRKRKKTLTRKENTQRTKKKQFLYINFNYLIYCFRCQKTKTKNQKPKPNHYFLLFTFLDSIADAPT
jgi:hypothetical protein